MIAGRMDRRIALYHRVIAQDTQGQQVETWPTAYVSVWAEKLDVRGREYFSAQTTNADLATRFRIRWRNDVLATDRLTLDGLSYNVSQVSEIGRRDGLELFAVAVMP
jgi:SPP1 family predicted phage head-tail adaptor